MVAPYSITEPEIKSGGCRPTTRDVQSAWATRDTSIDGISYTWRIGRQRAASRPTWHFPGKSVRTPACTGHDTRSSAMKTIDYIYRFDPKNPSAKPIPPDAEAARRTLEAGNRMFSSWMASCQTSTVTTGAEPQYVVPCNGLEVGMVRAVGQIPSRRPSPWSSVAPTPACRPK